MNALCHVAELSNSASPNVETPQKRGWLKRTMTRFANDEAGFVITAELVMIFTIAVLALSVGWGAVATLLAEELEDVANSVGSLNQSFNYRRINAVGHASCSGGGFNDQTNSVNVTTSTPNFSNLIPNISAPSITPAPQPRIQFRSQPDATRSLVARDRVAFALAEELVLVEEVIGTERMTLLIAETSMEVLVEIVREVGHQLLARTIVDLGVTRSAELIIELGATNFSKAVLEAESTSDSKSEGVQNENQSPRLEGRSESKRESIESNNKTEKAQTATENETSRKESAASRSVDSMIEQQRQQLELLESRLKKQREELDALMKNRLSR